MTTIAANPLLTVEPITLDDLRALAAEGRLYAVIDACDAPAVPSKMEELQRGGHEGAHQSRDPAHQSRDPAHQSRARKEAVESCVDATDRRAACLYQGDAERDFAMIAPFLVRVDDELLDWIMDELWSEPWGIFLVPRPSEPRVNGSPVPRAAERARTATHGSESRGATFEVLRRHLRKFLKVKLPDGKMVFFRYYDPRILAAFLPACNEAELREFFGPVESFITAGTWSGRETIDCHTLNAPARKEVAHVPSA